MHLSWLLHKPILLVLLILLVLAVLIIVLDISRYFRYYFRDSWTEATWIDTVLEEKQQEGRLDEGKQQRMTPPSEKGDSSSANQT